MKVNTEKKPKIFNLVVIVSALGYFVDIYDLQLFNLVGKQSLGKLGLNLPEAMIEKYDADLFLWQMAGMLIGGLIFGILGDRIGRKQILFASILMYSLANIANAFVQNVDQYALIRLIAGIGLSGELGAAITLVSEVMDKEVRGWGTMLIVATGALGAVLANLIARNVSWQTSYLIGGGLGLALLALRVGTFESGFFTKMKEEVHIKKGDFLSLFKQKDTFLKYVACIAVGLPVWFCIGVLIKFSAKHFATHIGVIGEVTTGDAIMWSYIGLSIGDLVSGWLSQVWRSRRKVVFAYLGATIVLLIFYVQLKGITPFAFYCLSFLIGAVTGFWALFVSIASEQFGTNIRATVTTTVPNFVRGAVIPITKSFLYLLPVYGLATATYTVGAVCIGLSLVSIWYLKETFAKDLNYYEEQ
jgi:MFS transporter, putative metabolite:H+ symporter